MEIKNPANTMEEITPTELLGKVMTLKNMGRRLSQICAAYANDKLELSYSFADDETNLYHNLRLVIDKETEVCSITEFYPYAFLYENEMKEMFDVKIQQLSLDFDKKLYRIEEDAPLLPESVKEERRAAAAEAAAGEQAQEAGQVLPEQTAAETEKKEAED